MADVATLVAGIDSTPAKQGAREFQQAADQVVQGAQQVDQATGKNAESFKTAGDSASSAASAVKALAGAYVLKQATSFVKDLTLTAARYEELGVALYAVGKNSNRTAPQLDALEQGLKKTGISAIESRQALLRLLQAQVDLTQATKLARVAQDAAVIGQLDSSEAFQRLVDGLQSGNTTVLKTIGLNVNFEDSYAKLKKQLNLTSGELNEQQKITARTNAIMEAGAKIAGAYEAAMGSAGKQLRSTKRYVDDLKVAVGEVFQGVFSAAVEKYSSALKFLDNNLEAVKIVAVGFAAALVTMIGLLTALGTALTIYKGVLALRAAFAAASVASIGLSSSLAALLTLSGVGAVLIGIGAAVAYFASEARKAKVATDEFKASIIGMSKERLESDFRDVGKELDRVNTRLSELRKGPRAFFGPYADEIKKLTAESNNLIAKSQAIGQEVQNQADAEAALAAAAGTVNTALTETKDLTKERASFMETLRRAEEDAAVSALERQGKGITAARLELEYLNRRIQYDTTIEAAEAGVTAQVAARLILRRQEAAAVAALAKTQAGTTQAKIAAVLTVAPKLAIPTTQISLKDRRAADAEFLANEAERLRAKEDLIKESVNREQALYENMLRTVSDVFKTTFDDILNNGLSSFTSLFKSIGNLFKNLLVSIASSALAKKIVDPIKDTFSAASKEGGGGVKGAIGKLAGNSTVVGGLVLGAVGGIVAGLISLGGKAARIQKEYDATNAKFKDSYDRFLKDARGFYDGLSGELAKSAEAFADIGKEALKVFRTSPLGNELRDKLGLDLGKLTAIFEKDGIGGLQKVREAAVAIGANTTDIDLLIARLKELGDQAGITAEEIRAKFALASKRLSEDLATRAATASLDGVDDPTAVRALEARNFALAQEREMVDALTAKWSDGQLEALTLAQTEERLAFGRKQAKQVAEELAATEEKRLAAMKESRDFDLDLLTRRAQLSGDAEQLQYAQLAVLKAKQQDELDAARKLVEAGTITESAFQSLADLLKDELTDAAKEASVAVAKAAEILQANIASLNQESELFGYSLDEQVSKMADLYGFAGKTGDQIKALYTKFTPGSLLSAEDSALNDAVAEYFRLVARRDAAAGDGSLAATSNLAGRTATNGTVYTGPVTIQIDVNVAPEDFKDGARLAENLAARISKQLAVRANLQNNAAGRI